ncbi:DNA-binding protein [Candidatus Enterococcus mansonii]|uniref:DNA-binding protein n=1 Tax=Candidatus Enterococcus mansonii TaxID=1834181 RepID=A0A242CHT2_9ENTE|nr:DNA-binding protein [Enterococcus sp. 4G2_DIV0659]OTO09688.1 hypothetical protein A5880_000368 [Enterococcus sp. 4G2_DIV0659]
MLSAEVKIILSEEQLASLQKSIYDMLLESLQEARKSAVIDQPFLKQNKAAAYLGISVNTLKKLEQKGLPSIRRLNVLNY